MNNFYTTNEHHDQAHDSDRQHQHIADQLLLTRQEKVEFISPWILKAHPNRLSIYGPIVPTPDFCSSVKTHGVKTPLIITKNNVIISGHLRHKAALDANLLEIPVIRRAYAKDVDKLEALLDGNLQRDKSNEVRGREIMNRMLIDKQRGNVRHKSLVKAHATIEKIGGRRDILGEAFGISGPTVAKLIETCATLQFLDDEGNHVCADAIRLELNSESIEAGYNAAVRLGYIAQAPFDEAKAD